MKEFRFYQVGQFLGKGGYGEVFKVRRISDGSIFAAKFMPSGKDSVNQRSQFIELATMSACECEHLIKLHDGDHPAYA